MTQIGADPELFVRHKGTGLMVSAHDMIPGTKISPFPVEDGSIQVDGLAAEFNIDPVSLNDPDEFIRRINRVREQLLMFVQTYDENLELVAQPVADFEAGYFAKIPKYAKVLGCEPDYNAYTGKPNGMPRSTGPFRTGSGHIHIGFTNVSDPLDWDHMVQCMKLVRNLDASLYTWSLRKDKDTRRRILYGKPGAFRPKPYGLEYRVLSNYWVDDPDEMKALFKLIEYTMSNPDFYKGDAPPSEAFMKEITPDLERVAA